jgi:2-oxoglutarate dehydrogenase E2 component (dihydrolipoamide succinyltransferase)
MKIEIKVPAAGESVTEAMISEWFKEDGEFVEKDEAVLELETDKANMELNAEEAGTVIIEVAAEEVVKVGQVIGYIDTEGADEDAGDSDDAKEEDSTSASEDDSDSDQESSSSESKEADSSSEQSASDSDSKKYKGDAPTSPSARRIAEENNLDLKKVEGSGRGGRVTKDDAQKAANQKAADSSKKSESAKASPQMVTIDAPGGGAERETTVKNMSMMRRRIAQRLVEAQSTAAILTTFNEVDMSAVMNMRNQYKDAFFKKHGVKLGFMSFFVKAACEALKHVPEINAYIEDNTIHYHNFCDVGVAVGTEKGLLVPIVRDADKMSFAQVEAAINNYAVKARDGKISLDDLNGGTFTISNGGIYGSLLSTPILNPPQSGILGMHKIEKRPVVINDEIVIRPMMYLALSYDHRIVDGKGAVTFLVKIKECLEDPARMLLEL